MSKDTTKRPAKPRNLSIYFDEKLHRQVKRRARSEDISMSQYFRRLARNDLAATNE